MRRHTWVWAAAILAIAVALRFFLTSLSTISGDGCWHLSAAEYFAGHGSLPLFDPIGRDEPFWAPPLFHILASFLYTIFGEWEMRMISPLFGSLSLVIAFLIFKKYLPPRQALYALTFLSFLPIMVDYSVLAYIDMMLFFFVLLSIFLGLERRFFLASVSAGLAILTKYHGVLAIPLLLLILYLMEGKTIEGLRSRSFLTKAAMVSAVPLLIALPWLLRNWALLGNPIWPFLNFLFHGYEQLSYSALDFGRLLFVSTWASTYLGFFGVPDGNYSLLFFFPIPYLGLLLMLFLLGTAVFLLPLFFGFRREKGNNPLVFIAAAVIGLFFLLFLVYVVNVGPNVSRILLPATLGLAVFFGIGAQRIEKILKRWRWIVPFCLTMLCVAFALILGIKFSAATHEWQKYDDDFSWVQQNTPKDAVFIAGGQCMPYHLHRTALFPSKASPKVADYLWVNDAFRLDPRSILTPDEKQRFLGGNATLAYQNSRTGTAIYRLW